MTRNDYNALTEAARDIRDQRILELALEGADSITIESEVGLSRVGIFFRLKAMGGRAGVSGVSLMSLRNLGRALILFAELEG